MLTVMLTIQKLRKAQADYRLFAAFNVVSFSFMTGNIIFLYAIRLGAGTRLIGFLSALGSITFLFSLLGRQIIRRLGVVKTRGYFWLARYLVMIPVLATIIPGVRGVPRIALVIITFCYFGFNLLKGIGLAAAKPILGYISRASDRAAFVSGNNMITFAGQIVTGLTMAFLLGKESPLFMYGLFIGFGIITGLFASHFALQLPEPELDEPVEKVSLFKSLGEALQRKEFSRLILLVMLSNLAIGMAVGFIVVYAKTVYGQADNLVVFFTVAGAFGALGMAGVSRFLTDRIGSKPMYFVFNGLRILILLPVIWAPGFATSRGAFLFLLAVFFMHQMTTWGIHSTADLYFFATTKAKDRIDLGIVFNITRGLFGMIGSLGGGFLLGWLQGRYGTADIITPFRIHFSLSALFLLANLPLIARLPDVSDYSIVDLLSIIFSPRDLKAIYYLNKLEKSTTSEEERVILSAMGNSKSRISLAELRKRLESPSFFARMEALTAMRGFPPDQYTVKLLIDEIRYHPYTTAHVAARMLGRLMGRSEREGHGFSEKLHEQATAVLIEALDSGDYLLKSKAAISLADMQVNQAGDRILSLLRESPNPRVIIYAVKALEMLNAVEALPLIFAKVGRGEYPHLTNDLILSSSGLLGMEEWFYPHYSGFLRREAKGIRSLRAEIEVSELSDEFHRLLDLLADSEYSSLLRRLITRTAAERQGGEGETQRLRVLQEYGAGQEAVETSRHIAFLLAAYLIRLHSPAPRRTI